MKYEKLMANVFARNSNNSAQVAFALAAGLAVGAALAVLFAPESGSKVRRGIRDKANGLGDGAKDLYSSLRRRIVGQEDSQDSVEQQEDQHAANPTRKRPKSDIRELIHEAHVNGIHTEQSLN